MKVYNVPCGDDEGLSVSSVVRSSAMYQAIAQLCWSKEAASPPPLPEQWRAKIRTTSVCVHSRPQPPPRGLASDAKLRRIM